MPVMVTCDVCPHYIYLFSVVAYATVVPDYHRPAQSETRPQLGTSEDAYYICNATISCGAHLFWEVINTQENGDQNTVYEPGEPIGTLNETALRRLCRESSADRFAVSLGRRELADEHTGVIVCLQQTALVVCDAQTNFSVTYACRASDADPSQRSRPLNLVVADVESGLQDSTVSTLIIVSAVLFSLFALASIVGITCVVVKIRSRKEFGSIYQETPPEATNPFFENQMEFPETDWT